MITYALVNARQTLRRLRLYEEDFRLNTCRWYDDKIQIDDFDQEEQTQTLSVHYLVLLSLLAD